MSGPHPLGFAESPAPPSLGAEAREASLGDYLAASRRPLVPGEFDCFLWLADWIVLNGHADPAAPWRGRYCTWKGAQRLITRAGGIVQLARAAAAAVRLPAIGASTAVAGDVAIGVMDDVVGSAALIRAGGFWAALAPGAGLVFGEARIEAAWRV